MKSYSIDLRTKILQSLRRGVSKSETARRFRVNRSTVGRYLKRLHEEDGSLAPKKAPGSHPKLDGIAMRLLEEDIEARAWATHNKRSEFLYGVCGIRVSEATLCRSIKHLGCSRKKVNRSQRERRVAEAGVGSVVGGLDSWSLVFVDEMGIHTSLAPS